MPTNFQDNMLQPLSYKFHRHFYFSPPITDIASLDLCSNVVCTETETNCNCCQCSSVCRVPLLLSKIVAGILHFLYVFAFRPLVG